MTPKFASAVDPVFSYVLELLDALERGVAREPAEEHEAIKGLISQGEAKVGTTAEWMAAKYALAAWIDELLIFATWPGHIWWSENTLEWSFFQSNDRATQFYEVNKEATKCTDKDAAEVFYLCVVLGFRGLYRAAEQDSSVAEEYGLPITVLAWLDQSALGLRTGGRVKEMTTRPTTPESAPPHNAQAVLMSSWLVAAVLGAFTVIIAVLTYTFPST